MKDYPREQDMYADVARWLAGFLADRHPKTDIRVFDASRRKLSRLIADEGLHSKVPPEWVSWDIYVDVVGVAVDAMQTHLAFVECKNNSPTLRDLSQLLGYSRIARPTYSFLISPNEPSDAVKSLIRTFNRVDVLQYHSTSGKIPRAITLARWLKNQKSIDWGNAISDDSIRIGRV